MDVPWEAMFAAAEEARTAAYAPYSKFHVGAAIACADGTVVKGCNVENASYGLTVCAERNAIAQVVLAHKVPTAVAIVVDSEKPTPPCGMCRQVLAEHVPPNTVIKSRTLKGQEAQWTVGELLPHLFSKEFL
jgi:cytidine deaminase